MKAMRIVRICLNAVMFVLFLLLMEQHLITDAAHEWLGITLFILFLIHNAINYKWYVALFKGKYNTNRIVLTVIDFLLWIAMIGCIVSSLIISVTVFSGLNLRGTAFGRALHLIATAWAFVLMALHLGLHWAWFVGMAKHIKINAILGTVFKWVFRIAVLAVCVYGLYVFINRAFYEELFLLTQFKAYDYEANTFVYLLETAAMAITFVGIAYYLKKLCLFLSRRHKEAEK